MKTKIINIIMVIIGIVTVFSVINLYSSMQTQANRMSNDDYTSSYNTSAEDDQVVKDVDRQYMASADYTEDDIANFIINEIMVYEEIHEMTNTLVKADDKWGLKRVSRKNINTLISSLKKSSYPDKGSLIFYLNLWLKGNYRSSAELHNYVWKQLGGNTGKAYGVLKITRDMVEDLPIK